MPNWCSNTLVIQGQKSEVDNVIASIKGKECPLDFNKIVPMPEELKKTTSPAPDNQKALQKKYVKLYGAGNWYDWALKNWGVKWNVNDASLGRSESGNEADISFDTAWAPPIPIVLALGKKFPNVSFELKYCEPGMCFAGKLEVMGEDIVDNFYEESKNSKGYEKMAAEFGYSQEDEEPEEPEEPDEPEKAEEPKNEEPKKEEPKKEEKK